MQKIYECKNVYEYRKVYECTQVLEFKKSMQM